MQQPCWVDGILDQVAKWLENAAADQLIASNHGWEPIRTDDCSGVFFDNWDNRKNYFSDSHDEILSYVSCHKNNTGGFIVNSLKDITDEIYDELLTCQKNISLNMFISTPITLTCDRYLPCYIESLDNLITFSKSIGIDNLNETIKKLKKRLNNNDIKVLFISFAIRRPIHLIHSKSPIEFITFAVSWKQKTKKKKTSTIFTVNVLANLDKCSPDLMRRFSGVNPNDKEVYIVGCGSVGSKIGMHLARSGSNNFHLIDNDWFLPHNTSRHTLINEIYASKSIRVATDMKNMGINATPYNEDVRTLKNCIPNEALVIDTTASLAIDNYLAQSPQGANTIKCCLYDNAKCGVICIEGKNHNPRTDDLKLRMHDLSLNSHKLKDVLFNTTLARQATGQGCGSNTIVASDSRISLISASMATRIQQSFSSSITLGELSIGFLGADEMSLQWQREEVGPTTIIDNAFGDGWQLRLLNGIDSQMEEVSTADKPNETGGVLIGHICYSNKTMTVTRLLPAPVDSKKSRHIFILGTKGLKRSIKKIESNSNGTFTYLGTWHSHPYGGSQSKTDEGTLSKILFLRDYEPTICLIWTPSGIIPVS